MTMVPTRGATESASFSTVCQLMLWKRWAMVAALIFWPSLRFLVGCSLSWFSSLASSPTRVGLEWSWHMMRATWRANLLGYDSVNSVRDIRVRPTIVWPAIGWCWWLPEQKRRCRHRCKSSEVERTSILFRKAWPLTGSFKLPTSHMSKRHLWEWPTTSCIPGTCFISDPSGCSKSKWSPRWTWWRYKTIPSAICHRFSWRASKILIWRSIDFCSLNWFHLHHGLQTGLYHTCFGRLEINCVNSCILPWVVCKSPWDSPNLWAWPPSIRACFVSSLWSWHITSKRSSRRWWNRGGFTDCNSAENCLTSFCTWFLKDLFTSSSGLVKL